MPVGEMLRRMTSAELTEWMAFYDLRANPPPEKQSPQQMRAVLDGMVSRGAAGSFTRRKSR
jgi:hypothetical protein